MECPDNKHIAISSGFYGEDLAYPVAVWLIDKTQRNAEIPQPASIFYPLTSTKWISWKNDSTLLTYSDNQTIPTALCFTYDLESWNVNTTKKTDFGYDFGVCGVDVLPANWKYLVEWSKDFKWVAYVEGDHINIAPRTPYETTKLLLKPTISVQAINWSPDTNYLIVQGLDNKTAKTRIEIWDVETGKLLKKLEFSNPIDEIVWSPDAKKFAIKIALVHDTSQIEIIDRNGDLDFTHSFTKPSNLISWSPDGQKLAIAEETSDTKVVHIIDATSNAEWFSYESNNTNLAWSADSEHLAYMISPKEILVFTDVISGTEIAQIQAMAVDSLTLSPDGTMLALGMDDGTIRIWDVADLMAK